MASFKIRFAHNCNCYNDNLLDLNSVALQNATLNGEKWEFGCMDQVALDLTNRKERWACFMETPPDNLVSTRGPWPEDLFFGSRAFTVDTRSVPCLPWRKECCETDSSLKSFLGSFPHVSLKHCLDILSESCHICFCLKSLKRSGNVSGLQKTWVHRDERLCGS